MPAPKGNKYAKGSSGRPKKFSSPKEMQKAIDRYFEECDNRTKQVYDKQSGMVIDIVVPKPYTIEGLCVALEIDRDTLLNYEKRQGYEEFFGTIKKAKIKVQQNLIERGLEGENNSAVSIFVMKNNFGYKDKSEQEISGIDGGAIQTQSVSEFKVIFENYE